MSQTFPWDPYFYHRFPGYESLALLWQYVADQLTHWPQVTDYNTLAKRFFVKTPLEYQVAFTEQLSDSFYEWQIYEKRLVPTRKASWHDFFNNLTWLCWPELKSALIKRLCEHSLMLGHSSRQRTPLQNLLTQFDEFGAIICSDNQTMIEMIKAFRWQAFFQIPDLQEHCQCVLIGHGLFEKLLDPFIGLTAKAIFLEVKPAYFKLPLSEQMAYVDHQMACYLLSEDFPHSPRALQPFPLLGWPTWYPLQDQHFYDNKDYFRAQRMTSGIEIAHWHTD